MTVQCYTPTQQCPLCSQHFCVQFLSILTWSWSWRWTPRRECLDPNCVRSDGCMLYKCGYRLPASPPVKIFKAYVPKYRVWTNTQTNKPDSLQQDPERWMPSVWKNTHKIINPVLSIIKYSTPLKGFSWNHIVRTFY